MVELRRAYGDPVLLLQADDEPLCLPAREMFVALEDAFAGLVAGCPVYLGRALDARHPDVIELDVEDGPPEIPSLAASAGTHFVAHARRRDPCTELYTDVPSRHPED